MTEGRTSRQEHGWDPDRVDRHLVGFTDPDSFEADQYRTLRHILEQGHTGKRLIAVTSAIPGEGKTTTALNLAGVLALAPEVRILVLDVDLRTPSVGPRLGLREETPGMVDLLLDPALTLRDIIRQHPQLRLAVVPAGRRVTMTYELLTSARLGAVLEEARRQYDYVVMDSPPIVPVTDSRLIAPWIDGYLMVVGAHRTPRVLFEEAMDLMDPAKLIGIVFNGDDRPLAGYYGSYYGHYGHRPRGGRRGRGQ